MQQGQAGEWGQATPKQFLHLLGKPVLAHALLPFEALEEVREIVLVIPPEWESYCRSEIVDLYGLKKITRLLPGGAERQDSVYIGLKAIPEDLKVVLVHDGARPLVSREIILESLRAAQDHGAAVVAIPLGDTLKQVQADRFSQGTLNREGLWLAQTPQAFRREVLLSAYEKAIREQFCGTDDASLVERMGLPVKIVEGSTRNLKVTTQEDITLAEALLREVSH